MTMKTFQFTEQTLSVIEELGGHMPGGFFVYAIVMAAVHYFTRDKSKIRKDFSCAGCALAGSCTDEQKALEAGSCDKKEVQ